MAVTLEAGSDAPPFTLKDQDGNTHSLADYREKTVVIYFYPKDDTAGCTTQACSIRDFHQEILDAGAVIIGVSPDSSDSHSDFAAKYDLPFPLLADEGAEVAKQYGAWGEKTLYGKKSIGMIRSTFIVGPDGSLVKVWKRAQAAEHGETVLKALRELTA